ncbi:MAG: hypothetical protein ACK4UR_02415 [Caldimicrobium sp.]
MILKVGKGTYEIIQKKEIILTTDYLGSGIALGFMHKSQPIYGLLNYIFPYKENDIEIDGNWIYSGETLLNLWQDALFTLNMDLREAKWILAGASLFKEHPSFLELGEKNLKVAEIWLKKQGILDQTIKVIKEPSPLILRINGKEKKFEITKLKNKVELYE